jgi:hypothetical protein
LEFDWRVFAGESGFCTVAASVDPLLGEEVLYSVSSGNKKTPICSGFVLLKEPSDGLEPSTPPYHGGFGLPLHGQ